MTVKANFFQRALSVVLCAVLIFSALPVLTFTAPAAESSGSYSSVADPHTLNNWKNFFGTQTGKDHILSTEFAGGIWTDKSVFDLAADLPGELKDAAYKGNHISATDQDDNFLVALSAIASNKEIKGYSTIPTDTVLVLDMSSSMRSKDANGGSAVDELAAAANEAISKLLALNYNNRIGVILYAGNTNQNFSSAGGNISVLLPLDTYTTSDRSGRFLEAYSNDQSMRVVSGVRNSADQAVSKNMAIATGTFTQGGIYEAMKMLCSADTTVNSGVQAGTDRIPIMVLMTDGEPTLANNNYYGSFNGNFDSTDFSAASIGNTTMYDFDEDTGKVAQPGLSGSVAYEHRDTIAFVSSLTAAFSKKMMGHHYGTKPLMYTLAYGDVVKNRSEALSFLNPAKASTIQNNLWNSFFTGKQVTVYNRGSSRYLYTQNIDQANDLRHLTAADRMYVDGYFHADNSQAGSMSEAFQAIVDEIILQSKYYPTFVETDYNHDGYLTFTDKIGSYMTVTDVQGIIVGDRLFSGAALAYGFTAEGSIFGSVENPSDLGDNLIWSVKERLNITDASIARTLIDTAYNYKQLYYNSDTDYSNYFGWFSDKDGNYVDFYHTGVTQQEIDAAKAKGATHIVRSYLYLGDTKDLNGSSSSNMMYMTVNVTEELASGDNMIVWRIPASLIPTLTYQIEVMLDEDGNPEDVRSLSVDERSANTPIRLVYEIAMDQDIYDWNVTEKVSDTYRDSTANKDAGYVFYSNKWSSTSEDDTALNTYSHFEPSTANERYYFINDTMVYQQTGSGYTPYAGSTQPSGTNYYRQQTIYKKMANGSLNVVQAYEPLSSNALADSVSSGGRWYVPKGTMQRQYTNYNTPKESNATATMGLSNNPETLYIPSTGYYYSANTLGNNGKLSVTPATGIKLTKTLLSHASGGDDRFIFTISGIGNSGVSVVRLDENGQELSRSPIPSNHQITLAANETVYIIGLNPGTYGVTEARHDDYQVVSATAAGNTVTANTITFAVADQAITDVEFQNQVRTYGSLTVAKNVIYPEGYTPNANVLNNSFPITVTFTGDAADLDLITLPAGLTHGTGSSRTYSIHLKDDHNTTFSTIPHGVSYSVAESAADIPTGYQHEDTDYSHDVHTITAANSDHLVHVVNSFVPVGTALTDISLEGDKTVVGDGWPAGAEFTVELRRVTDLASGTTEPTGYTYTVTKDNSSYYFASLNNVILTTPGTHFFQVVEVEPAEGKIPDMSYDKSMGMFSVTVDDSNGDGQLDITAVEAYETTGLTGDSTSGWTVTKDFTNFLTKDIIQVPVLKQIRNLSDDQLLETDLRGGILFGVFDSLNSTTPVFSTVTNAQGTGTIQIPVTQEMLGAEGLVYYLKEIPPAIGNRVLGMGYNTDWQYAIKITWDETENKAVAQWAVTNASGAYNQAELADFGTETSLAIENTYDDSVSVSLNLSGTKTLNDSTELGGKVFNFSVYSADYKYETIGSALHTVQNSGSIITFDTINFTAPGMHHLVIRESFAGTEYGGISLDKDYHVSVNVEKYIAPDGTTQLQILGEPHIHQQGSDASVDPDKVDFRNLYTVTGTTSQVISGRKVLTGRPMVTSEFRFQLTQVDESGSPITDGIVLYSHNGIAGGTPATAAFQFEEITFDAMGDYYFQINEIPGGSSNGVEYSSAVYTVKITVFDNNEGGLASSQEIYLANELVDTMEFHNEYHPRSVAIPLVGVKEVLTLDGEEIVNIPAGQFRFKITETQSDFHTVASYGIGERIIQNSGTNGNILDFGVMNFSRAGTRYFTIREIVPAEIPGTVLESDRYVYDTKVYQVTMTAADDHLGNLQPSVTLKWIEENPENPDDPIIHESDYPAFTNLYIPKPDDIPVDIVISKKVNNIGSASITPEGFQFSLALAGTEQKITTKSDAQGNAKFTLNFSEDHIGNIYHFKLSEVNTGTDNVTYSTAVYDIEVSISLNADNKLVAAIKQNGQAVSSVSAEFINTYDYTPPAESEPPAETEPPVETEPPAPPVDGPSTGDTSNAALWFTMLVISAGAMIALIVFDKKKLQF